MRKIKIFAFFILGAALVTIGLYSCSNDEVNSLQQEDSSITLSAKSNQEIEAIAIGNIENGNAIPLYNKDLLETNLVSKGLFAEIESKFVSNKSLLYKGIAFPFSIFPIAIASISWFDL